MSRRSSKHSRRYGESGGIGAPFGFNSQPRSSPYLPIALILLVLVHFGFKKKIKNRICVYLFNVVGLKWIRHGARIGGL